MRQFSPLLQGQDLFLLQKVVLGMATLSRNEAKMDFFMLTKETKKIQCQQIYGVRRVKLFRQQEYQVKTYTCTN